MAKKKKVQEEQPSVTQVATTKRKSPKKKEATEKAMAFTPEELDQVIEEDIEFSSSNDDSIPEKDYDIEDILEALEQKQEPTSNKEEPVSDEILDKFDKTLEEKGLGDAYFQKLEKQLKEQELEHELHEFAIDEMLNEED